jgi:hypothetical protein
MIVDAKDLGSAVTSNTKAQADALKRAAVRTLTRAAGMAQDKLIEAEKRVFKAPVPFTTNTSGYRLYPARASQPDPESKFSIKQRQSDYLRFPIEGGERKPGDAGAWGNVDGRGFVFKPTENSDRTASGALVRFFTRRLAKEAGRKKARRGGGVYFGKLNGGDDTGWILRPDRTKALTKTGRGGKVVLARPHGAGKVHDVGNAKMLVQAAAEADYRTRLPYAPIMRQAMDEATSELGRRLKEELGK